FVGEVGGAHKRELLAGARCLWMPVRWEDPCPVNILEAFASGTPVIGSPRGSLPELISPDTGGLGTTLDELAALRSRLAEWDPGAQLRDTPVQHDLTPGREVAGDIRLRVRKLGRADGRELEHAHVGARAVAGDVAARPELLVDVHSHGGTRERAHEGVAVDRTA